MKFPFCTAENYDNIAGVPEPINQSNVAPLKMIMLSALEKEYMYLLQLLNLYSEILNLKSYFCFTVFGMSIHFIIIL